MTLTFRDLKIWQEALLLMEKMHSVTSKFPPEEMYALTNQTRRAAVSVMANIAEGF